MKNLYKLLIATVLTLLCTIMVSCSEKEEVYADRAQDADSPAYAVFSSSWLTFSNLYNLRGLNADEVTAAMEAAGFWLIGSQTVEGAGSHMVFSKTVDEHWQYLVSVNPATGVQVLPLWDNSGNYPCAHDTELAVSLINEEQLLFRGSELAEFVGVISDTAGTDLTSYTDKSLFATDMLSAIQQSTQSYTLVAMSRYADVITNKVMANYQLAGAFSSLYSIEWGE